MTRNLRRFGLMLKLNLSMDAIDDLRLCYVIITPFASPLEGLTTQRCDADDGDDFF